MIIVLFVFLSIFTFCLLLWQISNLISVFSGSPYVMMDKDVIRQALKLAKLRKGEIFYDLGCGNGDVLIQAAKMGANCEGFEISPYYYLLAKIKISIWRSHYYFKSSSIKSGSRNREKIEIKVDFINIRNVDLSKANVIYCYLMPGVLEKLALKFNKEMEKGSRIVSIGFPVFDLEAKKVGKFKVAKHNIFIYRF